LCFVFDERLTSDLATHGFETSFFIFSPYHRDVWSVDASVDASIR
jgi:hypothetical protein